MRRRLLAVVIATVVVLFPNVASAQDPQQLFNFFLDQAGQELQRQQQLENQRRQQQHEQFVTQWYACQAGEIDACQLALAYPHLSASDRRP
jgi:hypothetical protein